MPYHHLVMTAGVSAFAGNNLGRRWLTTAFPGQFPDGAQVKAAPDAQAALLEAARRAELPAVHDERSVCAELSMVAALRRDGGLAVRARVDLVHTATFAGALAAIFVARVLEAHCGVSVEAHAIDDLDAERPEAMRKSLAAFMATVARCLDGADPRGTCFAPIGGYKVMTSLGYLTGALLGFDTLYLHETGQRLIRVPAVPLDIRPEGLVAVRPVLWRVRDAGLVAAVDLTPAERLALDRHPYLFDRVGEGGGELVAVGPFAELLLATEPHRRALRREVRVAREVNRRDHHVLAAAIEALLDELDGPRRDDLLFHERAFKHHATPFHAFKTRTDGRFRLVWRLAAPDRLEVRQAWINDHDAYERALTDGAILGPADASSWDRLP